MSEFESTLLDGAVAESDADYTSRLVGNPVHAFNLIRRFSIDIPNIEKDIKEDDWKGDDTIDDDNDDYEDRLVRLAGMQPHPCI